VVQLYLSYSNNQYSDRNTMKKQKIPHCPNSSKIIETQAKTMPLAYQYMTPLTHRHMTVHFTGLVKT
jgi:hypothetical protein